VAEVIWTEPALDQLEEIAEYIALDKPGAASSLVKEIFTSVERLEMFPESGHVAPELPASIYRELYVRPCRLFYRNEDAVVLILHVMREERQLRRLLLDPELDS
jgi:plasmid stabilization system protein ParE